MPKELNITENLEKYIVKHSDSISQVQKDLIKENLKLGEIKKMQISIIQSNFLQFTIKTLKIRKILEIGTFTGFSTLSMALALPNDGEIVTLDKNEKTNSVALKFFKMAKVDKKIKQVLNPALISLDYLTKKNEIFDLIFIDADKENYKNYYEKSLGMLKKDGLVIIDNVLWHGDVSDLNKNDRFVKIIRDFNEYVKKDERVNKLIFPLGDGLTICIKK